MKKATPLLLTAIVLLFITAIVVAASRKMPRQMDERITLKQRDKIPYGFAAARSLCGSLFPYAKIVGDNKSPGYWDEVFSSANKQAVILVGSYFNADEYEVRQLMNFVEKGNYVFIIAKSFSPETQSAFHFSYNQNGLEELTGKEGDSLNIHLKSPPFDSDSFYTYPGKKLESWFDSLDLAHTTILGTNGAYPNFIRMDKGQGSFFVHSAPLAFSNYFILHKNNIHYLEQALSVIPAGAKKIVWNEYYLLKRESNKRNKEPDWLGILFKYPAFKWGLLTILGGIFLFVLLASRRKQRMISHHPKPKNDSLDFVKTMGRLYYDRRDHQDLAKKMATYFLEHIRSAYQLPTTNLNESFIEALHYKSGYKRGELNAIVSFINYLHEEHSVTEYQLINFQNQLEAFYQNT